MSAFALLIPPTALTGLPSQAYRTFRYRAYCYFAEPCVFDKQSLPPFLCHYSQVALTTVTLIPKLRVQFAEFLQHSSLKRLGILYQSTRVGFGYGL